MTESNDFRETIVVAHGPNTDGQHHQVIAAQGDEATKRELAERAMLAAEKEAGVPPLAPVHGIEAGEGDEEGITPGITDASSAPTPPAEER